MKTRVFASAGLVVLVAVTALAQGRGFRGFGGGLGGPFTVPPNVRYDGRFTFVRLKYTTAPGGYWYRGLPEWAHGYPVAEQNLMRIMNEVSSLEAARHEALIGDIRATGARIRLIGDGDLSAGTRPPSSARVSTW